MISYIYAKYMHLHKKIKNEIYMYCFVLFASIMALPALAQPPSIPVFKSICVTENETGFKWKSNRWAQTNYRAGDKYLVQKLDVASFGGKPRLEKPISCNDNKPQSFGNWIMISGCYLIKELGTEKSITMAETCDEHFTSGSLLHIQCRDITFQPDGGYIGLPARTSISPDLNKTTKDSLVLSVGKCSRIE